jgi:hypothetical protein
MIHDDEYLDEINVISRRDKRGAMCAPLSVINLGLLAGCHSYEQRQSDDP